MIWFLHVHFVRSFGVKYMLLSILYSALYTQGCGSGFIISRDGLIVTNAHVVRSAKRNRVQVELQNGRTFTGEVQVIDSQSDLALVKIEAVSI